MSAKKRVHLKRKRKIIHCLLKKKRKRHGWQMPWRKRKTADIKTDTETEQAKNRRRPTDRPNDWVSALPFLTSPLQYTENWRTKYNWQQSCTRKEEDDSSREGKRWDGGRNKNATAVVHCCTQTHHLNWKTRVITHTMLMPLMSFDGSHDHLSLHLLCPIFPLLCSAIVVETTATTFQRFKELRR